MEIIKIPPENIIKNKYKTVVFSQKVMQHFLKLQEEIETLDLRSNVCNATPYVAMLGADKCGVVQGAITIHKGGPNYPNKNGYRKNKGCFYLPAMTPSQLSEATVDLVAQKLTPCGILRVNDFEGYRTPKISEDMVGTRIKNWCEEPNSFSVTIFKEGMLIEQIENFNKREKYTYLFSHKLGWITEGCD
jgi:hypothetical protein